MPQNEMRRGEIPVRRTFQTSDGVRLSFLETGAQSFGAQKPTIALIPGWSMSAVIWHSQLAALGGRFHVAALDPRGQGESSVPTSGYTAERRATDVRDFLKAFSNSLLVGWSLGALEALQCVHMFGDEQISGLVLVDSSVGEAPAPPAGEDFRQRLRENRDKALDEFIRAIFKTPRTEDEIVRLLKSAKQMGIEDSLALLSYPFERAHWRRIAHSFSKPLLYIVTPQFAGQARNLKKNRPATQIEIFTGAGHALFVDEPERFNSLIETFAAGLPAERE